MPSYKKTCEIIESSLGRKLDLSPYVSTFTGSVALCMITWTVVDCTWTAVDCIVSGLNFRSIFVAVLFRSFVFIGDPPQHFAVSLLDNMDSRRLYRIAGSIVSYRWWYAVLRVRAFIM